MKHSGPIKKIVKNIFNFVVIVVPVTKLILGFSNKLTSNNRGLEKFLSKSSNLLFISLGLAITVFIIIDQKIIYYSESSAEVLTNQTVRAIYNEEAYVIEGLPDTVDITLIGDKANLYIAKQSKTNDVTVDLTELKAGTHKVEFKYNQGITSVDYKVNPSFATVIIYNKVSLPTTLSVDVLNKDKLNDKLIIDSIGVDDDSVVVRGADKQVKRVAAVKALLDVNNLSSQDLGNTVVKDVPLKAYDEKGNVIDVELVPSKVNVNVSISSPSKELPIKVIPNGDVAFGKAISNIKTSESKVTVYGSASSLEALNYIPVEVDVNNLSENTQYKLEISKPVGVKSMSINNITVDISLDSVSDRDINNVAIETRNLASDLKATAVSSTDSAVDVNIKGVSSVINSITADSINAYVDLSGYGEGEHEVDVTVEGNDVRVQYVAKTKKVKIRISKK